MTDVAMGDGGVPAEGVLTPSGRAVSKCTLTDPSGAQYAAGSPVNVLPKLGASATLAVTTATNSVALPGGGSRYSVTADGCNMAIKPGGGSVSAAVTDHYVANGERIEFAVDPANDVKIAAIALSGSGTLRISQLLAA